MWTLLLGNETGRCFRNGRIERGREWLNGAPVVTPESKVILFEQAGRRQGQQHAAHGGFVS